MTKKTLLTTLIVLGCLFMGGGNLTGQTTIQIGNGTSKSYQAPINLNDRFCFTEMIYQATDINQSENKTITAISFYYELANQYDKSFTVDIFMKNTEKVSFTKNSGSNSTEWETMTIDDRVYSGTMTLPSSAGWFTITLNRPFEYNYSKNLIIAVNKTIKNGFSTYSGGFNTTTNNNNTYYSLYINKSSDDGAYDPSTISAGGTPYNGFPNIKITFDDGDSCITPSGLAAETTSASTANVSWTRGNEETEWTLQYSTDADFSVPANITTIEDITTTTKELTGLTANTTYYVRVKAVCGVGDESGWTDAVNFTTFCSEPIPYSYDFEDDDVLDCWTIINPHASTGIATNQYHSSSNSFYFFSSIANELQYLITPELIGTSDHGVQVEFYLYSSSTTTKFYVGYSKTNNNVESFTWSTLKNPTSTYTWEPLKYLCPSGTKFVAIKFEKNNNLNIDDISFTVPTHTAQNGDWNDSDTWSNGEEPTSSSNILISSNVTIPSGCNATANSILFDGGTLRIANGGKLTLSNETTGGTTASLIIADGGQLICNNAIQATVEKDIDTWNTGSTNGWYFISSPINASLNPSAVENMLTEDLVENEEIIHTFDLYSYNVNNMVGAEYKPWVNYRAHSGEFTIENGMGYLYASKGGTTLRFKGEILPNNTNKTVSGLNANEFNLVGNPYTCNAYVNQSYFTLSQANDGVSSSTTATVNSTPILPCTGVVVKPTNDYIKFSKNHPVYSNNNGNILMMLAQTFTTRDGASTSSATLDNAIVSFNEGSQLEKFYFGKQNANIYIPQGTEEYAIVNAEAQGEMPVNFKANENGQYTLTVNTENVEMNYLHLIDNMTGADIDLLLTPSYTFSAKTYDYESRFRLVFAANEGDGPSTGSGTFAFMSDGNLIINAGPSTGSGTSTLQVIDMTGRMVSSEAINGCANIDAKGLGTGVYVLRLVNGNNTKTQKIVVR